MAAGAAVAGPAGGGGGDAAAEAHRQRPLHRLRLPPLRAAPGPPLPRRLAAVRARRTYPLQPSLSGVMFGGAACPGKCGCTARTLNSSTRQAEHGAVWRHWLPDARHAQCKWEHRTAAFVIKRPWHAANPIPSHRLMYRPGLENGRYTLCGNPTSCVCRVHVLGKTVEAVLSSRKHPALLQQLHDNVDSLQKSRCFSIHPILYACSPDGPRQTVCLLAFMSVCVCVAALPSVGEQAWTLPCDRDTLRADGWASCRVALRKAYIKRHHEFIASIETAASLERTPDDSLRYQSVTFSLIRALDKVAIAPPFLPACPCRPLTATPAQAMREKCYMLLASACFDSNQQCMTF